MKEKKVFTQAKAIQKYKTNELINFLCKEEDLKLDEDDLKIICKQKVYGYDFLKITEKKLCSISLPLRSASRLADFVKELGKRKLHSYLSYKTLKDLREVLGKYSIDSNEIKKISPFVLKFMKIADNNKKLKQCIIEIKRKMGVVGLIIGSNEAICCEYITPILYAFIYITRRITKQKITLDP